MSGTAFAVRGDGGEIGGWRTGSGPPALLLHGGPGLSEYTGELADELAGLVDAVRYQQRGLAPTTVTGPATVETHVADAIAVLDGLEVERAWVVGHSWGGHLAMHLAVAAPERVLGVVAVDPLGAVPDGGEAELEANLTGRLPPEVTAKVAELDARLMSGEGSEADGAEMLRLLWPYYLARPEAAPPMPPTVMDPETYAETWASIHEHFERGTLVSGLPAARCPFLFLAGRESPIPWRRSAESAELVPGARLELVEGSGHFPWIEQPGSVAAACATLF